MKKVIAMCVAIFSVCQFASGNNSVVDSNTPHFIQKIKYIEGSEIPSFIEIRSDQNITLNKFLNYLNSLSSEQWSLKELKRSTDELGITHVTYQQYYKNIPVAYTKYHVHIEGNKVIRANGNFGTQSPVNQSNPMTENSALNYALQEIGATTYKWELPVEEAHIKEESGDPKATYFPKGELTYLPGGKKFNEQLVLCWKFNVYAHKPISRQILLVNATSGKIELENDLIHHTDVQGTAVTAYSGVRTITTDSTAPGNYRLRESARGNGIITLDLGQGTTYGAATDFTDTDNNWNNVNAQQDEVATDAHWGAEVTYDYLHLVHNRNSIDDNGFTLRSYVHYDVDFANAFWDGQRMTYGDGSQASGISALVALDIAGHEIAHGLTTFSADLIYQNESGALNESFSDIFGTAIEFYGKPSLANWTVGEDIGATLRSMSNPGQYGDPDTYLGNNWFSGTADNGGVHTNSGVQNKWFYILSQGETGVNDLGNPYSVNGIGMIDAAKIAYRNLTVYLTPTSDHAEARFYAIQSAIDLYGACSPEVEATTDAWYAVGVGVPYVPYVLSDFSTTAPTSCIAPHTVGFVNNSVNGVSFFWDFGDGNTSTNYTASHTYNTAGSYDVTLIVDGGSCGADTITIDSAIEIGPNVPCTIVLPTTGSASQQNACNGKLFDSGGPVANYGDNENSVITIAPLGATNVTISFPQFDIEPGSGNFCDYDYVEIFDGNSTNATSLGRFCNTTGNPGTITSTGGAITIEFSSDQGLNMSGFEMDWVCSFPNVAPSVDFMSDVTETCSGEITFEDLTLYGPSSWTWDFGDGNTSTLQNPSHTYTQSGFYTVTLTASNAFGTNSTVKTSYVDVSLPTVPVIADLNICLNNADTVISTSSGVTYWYDSTGTNLVHIGDSLIIPNVTNNVSYYIENRELQTVQNVGPIDNTFGGGGNFNNYQYLIFDAYKDMVLQSVLVYSSSDAPRTIELRDDQGQVVLSKTVVIPSGTQRVELDFEISPGTNYQLGLSQNSVYDLYRNNSGPSFPYDINGLVSITRSSANTDPFGYYYFFYDWEVREKDCVSELSQIEVKAIDCNSVGIEDINWNSQLHIYPNPLIDELNIELSGIDEEVEFTILDVTGKHTIIQQHANGINRNFSIDVSSLSKGIYIFQVTKQNSSYNQTIIKQ